MSVGQATEDLHHQAYASQGQAKHEGVIALAFEITAAVLAVLSALGTFKELMWIPLFGVGLILIAVFLRHHSSLIKGWADNCRVACLEAYIDDKDLDKQTIANAADNRPIGIKLFCRGKTVQSLSDYYGHGTFSGPKRRQILYQQNAFYTWRLLRSTALVYSIFATVLGFATVVVLYRLATAPPDKEVTKVVIEGLMSIVVVQILLRFVEQSLSSWSAQAEIRRIAKDLELKEDNEYVRELGHTYNKAVAKAPTIPTLIYWWNVSQLGLEWQQRTT